MILQGQATFYDQNETVTVVNRYEGILLPRVRSIVFRAPEMRISY